MKKFLSLVLVLAMLVSVLTLTSCGDKANADFKVGMILIGDETEGYSKAHIDGLKKAAENLGLTEDQILWRYNIPESDAVTSAAEQLVAEGCSLVITNSYGHQDYTLEAAKEYPDVQFLAMTGDTAKAVTDAGTVSNLSNAFNGVYESRYVSGVVAGLKVKELEANGKLTDANYDADGNIKLGYVGAFTFAEVISGYTSFFLGARSVVPNLSMEVYYTSSWSDFDGEKAAAEILINDGCVVIGQHADTAGAPTAVESAFDSGKEVYCVGYNVSMLNVAADSALTSATADWSVYYTYAVETAMKGEKVATNWTGAYKEGAVGITELGANVAEGTADYVADVEKQLKDGSLHVFDINTFTVEGQKVESYFGYDTDGDFVYDTEEVIIDGYFHESYVQSAPAFNLHIDGITELNQAF